jgi:hypothetical protein
LASQGGCRPPRRVRLSHEVQFSIHVVTLSRGNASRVAIYIRMADFPFPVVFDEAATLSHEVGDPFGHVRVEVVAYSPAMAPSAI